MKINEKDIKKLPEKDAMILTDCYKEDQQKHDILTVNNRFQTPMKESWDFSCEKRYSNLITAKNEVALDNLTKKVFFATATIFKEQETFNIAAG